MSSLSARYATPTLAVLVLALIPTVVNSYVGRKVVELPPLADALPAVLDGRASTSTKRKASSIKREFDSEDWVERLYERPGAAPVTVLVVRSYDMKRLYHHPELAVTEHEYERERLVPVATSGKRLQVHVLEGTPTGLAAYALVYRGDTVGNPYTFQLRVAPELLLTGQRALTLVFAEESSYRATSGEDVEHSGAVQTVVQAVEALMGSTGSGT